jgi:hypothetical protein
MPSPRRPSSGGDNVVNLTGPKYEKFALYETRLITFRDWPQAMPQTPEMLAEAGFFYLGK